VILPDFTFPATANVVELIGATPVLVDIDLETFNIDPVAARGAISSRTKALMPVHLFGLSADMNPLAALAHEHGLTVIEDAACALGSFYGGRPCGTIGDVGCFSFHPRKVITTGEGGMIVTSDPERAQRLRRLRAHGMASRGGRTEFVEAGLNYRLTEMQGAIGVLQMKRLPSILSRRHELAAMYTRTLADVTGLKTPTIPENCVHSWQSYVVLLDEIRNRDKVLEHLRHENIEATIGTHAVSMQPHVGGRVTDVTRSRRAFRQSISLPLYPSMTDGDLALVAEVMTDALR
jgi:dTDP-4-amino-4,6-dideoxygalactose transaminase